MRKIAATYIFPGNDSPLKNAVLFLDDNGTVLDMFEQGENFHEKAGVEFYSGILAPGFVNAHCHIEFSHLYHKLEENTGLAGFIGQINRLRHAREEEVQKAMQVADRRMWAEGIAAVGDVSNSNLSLSTKLKSKIRYHTFVEVFGVHPSRAARAFEAAQAVQTEFVENGLSASIVPHSPYSVSVPLFRKIEKNAIRQQSILSIHNQESEEEIQFLRDGTGPLADHIRNNLGIDTSQWNPNGKSSIETALNFLPSENRLLLVHNTFTHEQDIRELDARRSKENTFLVLCPNSNLFIENELPPVSLFRQYDLNLSIGTDSLASNHRLSILQEMITLQERFPEIKLEELIGWACRNGARALGFDKEFGCFEKGKQPGVNLLTGVDMKNLKLTPNSRVKRLL